MAFGEVRGALLQGLVAALTPASQVVSRKAIVLQSTRVRLRNQSRTNQSSIKPDTLHLRAGEPDTETAPLPTMLQQAAAAKAIKCVFSACFEILVCYPKLLTKKDLQRARLLISNQCAVCAVDSASSRDKQLFSSSR